MRPAIETERLNPSPPVQHAAVTSGASALESRPNAG